MTEKPKRRATLPAGVDRNALSTHIATWFHVGLIRPAPGTWGSMAAVPIGFVLAVVGGTYLVFAGAVVAFVAGLWASHRMIKQMSDDAETDDQPSIVIDEVAGQLLALTTAAVSPFLFVLGFAFFRVFDIFKPWPISWVERRTPGAWGVMADDILAGLFAAVSVWIVAYLMRTYV